MKLSFELRKLECNLFLSYKNHEKKNWIRRLAVSNHKHSESKDEKILLTEVLSLWAEHMICGAVNCRLKALGLYIFVRVFRRALDKLNGGAYIQGRIITELEKALRNKLTQCWFKYVLQLMVKASKYHNKSNSFQCKLEGRIYWRECYWWGLY